MTCMTVLETYLKRLHLRGELLRENRKLYALLRAAVMCSLFKKKRRKIFLPVTTIYITVAKCSIWEKGKQKQRERRHE